jgi:hypothetical protein
MLASFSRRLRNHRSVPIASTAPRAMTGTPGQPMNSVTIEVRIDRGTGTDKAGDPAGPIGPVEEGNVVR